MLKAVIPFGRKFGAISGKLILRRSHKGAMVDREKAVDHYQRHIEDVKATAFANINDRAEFQKVKADMVRGAYFVIAMKPITVFALAFAGFRFVV